MSKPRFGATDHERVILAQPQYYRAVRALVLGNFVCLVGVLPLLINIGAGRAWLPVAPYLIFGLLVVAVAAAMLHSLRSLIMGGNGFRLFPLPDEAARELADRTTVHAIRQSLLLEPWRQ